MPQVLILGAGSGGLSAGASSATRGDRAAVAWESAKELVGLTADRGSAPH